MIRWKIKDMKNVGKDDVIMQRFAEVSWQAITVRCTGRWSSSNVIWNDARAANLGNVAAVCKVGCVRRLCFCMYGVHCNTPSMPILIENGEEIMINQWGERSGLDKKICLSLLVTFCRNPRPLTLKVEQFDSI